MADDPMSALLLVLVERINRLEHKLDTLVAALASEEEDDGAVRSLDGDLFPARDERKALR